MKEVTIQIDDDTILALNVFFRIGQNYVKKHKDEIAIRYSDLKMIPLQELLGKYEAFLHRITDGDANEKL